MDDVFEIEAELKKLRPVPPGTELTARIERALGQERFAGPTSQVVRQNRSRTNWLSLGLGLGLAAAAGLLMLARMRDVETPARQHEAVAIAPRRAEAATHADAVFLPAGLTEVLYNMRDEGLQFPEGSKQPLRRLRYQTRETLRWRNPQTGASLHVSYPSEEIVLAPVEGQ